MAMVIEEVQKLVSYRCDNCGEENDGAPLESFEGMQPWNYDTDEILPRDNIAWYDFVTLPCGCTLEENGGEYTASANGDIAYVCSACNVSYDNFEDAKNCC